MGALQFQQVEVIYYTICAKYVTCDLTLLQSKPMEK